MSNTLSRLQQAKELVLGKTQDPNSLPWDPDSTTFPSRKDLPLQPGYPTDSAWVWGKDDNRGRLNLLTPTRIKAASSYIQTGQAARLDLPLNVPLHPAFGRETFKHEIKTLLPGLAYDDIYHLNTQSGTQWDGFRHAAHAPTRTFYNNTTASDIEGPTANNKCSIHHWSTNPTSNSNSNSNNSSSTGLTGRALLLDYRTYAETNNMHYDTATSHAIPHSDLIACGKSQGLDIRPQSQGGDVHPGDILLIRTGFVKDYYSRTVEANKAIGDRPGDKQAWAGVKQEPAMIDWLHDCYFAAVGGDAPAFERWPSPVGYHLHEYLLALWGVPIGEMLDLERVSELARENKRYIFFFTSAPANCPGGVSSHVNGTAIF